MGRNLIASLMIIWVAALLGAGFIWLVITVSSGRDSPQEVFEAHLQALDEGRLTDAQEFVDITCGQLNPSSIETAVRDLHAVGLTFQTAFPVKDVWTNQQETQAILELDVPPTRLPLPRTQLMMRVEGEWKLACT